MGQEIFPVMRGGAGMGQEKSMRGGDEDPILRPRSAPLPSLISTKFRQKPRSRLFKFGAHNLGNLTKFSQLERFRLFKFGAHNLDNLTKFLQKERHKFFKFGTRNLGNFVINLQLWKLTSIKFSNQYSCRGEKKSKFNYNKIWNKKI